MPVSMGVWLLGISLKVNIIFQTILTKGHELKVLQINILHQVLANKLPFRMWTRKGSHSLKVSALVFWWLLEQIFKMRFLRYLPRHDKANTKTCRFIKFDLSRTLYHIAIATGCPKKVAGIILIAKLVALTFGPLWAMQVLISWTVWANFGHFEPVWAPKAHKSGLPT